MMTDATSIFQANEDQMIMRMIMSNVIITLSYSRHVWKIKNSEGMRNKLKNSINLSLAIYTRIVMFLKNK